MATVFLAAEPPVEHGTGHLAAVFSGHSSVIALRTFWNHDF
jgi:hypothetical protein